MHDVFTVYCAIFLQLQDVWSRVLVPCFSTLHTWKEGYHVYIQIVVGFDVILPHVDAHKIPLFLPNLDSPKGVSLLG